MNLDDLNRGQAAQVSDALLACGGSKRWVNALLALRPFATKAALLESADAAWRELGPNDWREALLTHPRIGESGSQHADARSRDWSAGEQSGVDSGDRVTRRALAEANKDYEARFGHTFLIDATGKTSGEILAALRQRMHNAPDAELLVAGAELGKIARLRLEKLLGTPPAGTRSR